MEIPKKRWIEWLKVKGLAPYTIKLYCDYFDLFDISNLNQDYCIAFLNRYNNYVAKAFIKNLFEFIYNSDMPEDFKKIVLGIRIPKTKTPKAKRDIIVLSESDIHSIKEAMPGSMIKFKLMLYISYYGGLRISELVGSKGSNLTGLRPIDFNYTKWDEDQNQLLSIRVKGKGGKFREVCIPPNVASVTRKWINRVFLKGKKGKAFYEPLFKMSSRRWQKVLARYGYKALGRTINPHLLRHSCANYLRQKGTDLETIRHYLGHTSIATTQKYLHITTLEMKKEISKAFL
jgi:integrase